MVSYSSMKTFLKTVFWETLGFLLMCVFGTIAGAIIFMLYNVVTSYVVGAEMTYILPDVFFDGILVCFPPILLFVPMFRFLSLVRHKSRNKPAALAVICVLSLATWFFLVPVCEKTAYAESALFERPPSELTAGYFRKLDSDIYYLNSVENKHIDALKFDNSDSGKTNSERRVEFVENQRKVFERDEYGFSDPLVGSILRPPSIFAAVFQGLYSMEKSAYSACASGIVGWILFSSLMFALLSSGALVSASTWRLASAFWILFSTVGTIALNYLYMNSYFAPFTRRLNAMGNVFIFINNNFQFIMNCVITVALLSAGIACSLGNKDPRGDDL